MVNRIMLNETSYFGRGSREKVAEEILNRGYQKILVVTDYNLMDKIPTSTDEISTRTTTLLDNIGNYIQALKAKLNDLNMERANASSSV